MRTDRITDEEDESSETELRQASEAEQVDAEDKIESESEVAEETDDSDNPPEVASNTVRHETKSETLANSNRAEIERAIAEVGGTPDAASDIQALFTESHEVHRVAETTSPQEAYGIPYELIGDRASAASNLDTDLRELASEPSFDRSSNPDLESILDPDPVDDELWAALRELGVDEVNDAVVEEEALESVELIEYGR